MNGGEVEILSTATSTQFPNHKTNKKNDTSKQLSKQAIRQGKLREITKCLLTRFSKLNGRYIGVANGKCETLRDGETSVFLCEPETF